MDARPALPRALLAVWCVDLLLPGAAAVASLALGDERGVVVALAGFGLVAAPAVLPGLRRMPWLVRLTVGTMVAVQFTAESFRLYDQFFSTDKIVHAVETGTLALALAYLPCLFAPPAWRRWALLGTALAALGLAACWEMIEFASDVLFGTSLQVSNLDTMTDLLADLAGSAAGSFAAGRFRATRSGQFLAADFSAALVPTRVPLPAGAPALDPAPAEEIAEAASAE